MARGMKSEKKKYGSIRFYHPNGDLMFLSNQIRANWYLSRNLAVITEKKNNPETGEEETQAIQLTFTPKGKGQILEHNLTPLKNICVVCGEELYVLLTRHHVFPECYKEQLPENIKSKNHYDIFRICIKHHDEYEIHAQKLKKQIAKELGVASIDEAPSEEERIKRKIPGVAKTILNEKDKIPAGRLDYLFEELKAMTGLSEISEDNLKKLADTSKKGKQRKKKEQLHGYQVIQKITNLQEFVEKWRQHFIDYAKPKYLPPNWRIEEKTYQNNKEKE